MFEYLNQYKNISAESNWLCSNRFDPITVDEIVIVEQSLRYNLPEQLKLFYQEIGFGSLKVSYAAEKDYKCSNLNMIHHPLNVLTIIYEGQSSGMISEDVCAELQPGDIPFFEIGDSSSFLKMKALSDNPNAVWDTYESDTYKAKIADSLEEFIYRLYYESTYYYEDIIAAEILEMKKRQKAQQ